MPPTEADLKLGPQRSFLRPLAKFPFVILRSAQDDSNSQTFRMTSAFAQVSAQNTGAKPGAPRQPFVFTLLAPSVRRLAPPVATETSAKSSYKKAPSAATFARILTSKADEIGRAIQSGNSGECKRSEERRVGK